MCWLYAVNQEFEWDDMKIEKVALGRGGEAKEADVAAGILSANASNCWEISKSWNQAEDD